MSDKKRDELNREEGFSTFDAGEVDYLLSDPRLREIIEELEKESLSGDLTSDNRDVVNNDKNGE